MFTELTQELFDLTATEKGAGGAMYASSQDPGCSSSSICCCFDLCCTHLCW